MSQSIEYQFEKDWKIILDKDPERYRAQLIELLRKIVIRYKDRKS